MGALRRTLRTAVLTGVLTGGLVGMVGPARADTKTCIGISEEGQRQRADKKLIAAKDLFMSCGKEACPKIVREDCLGWLKEVDAQQPTVVFAVRDQAGQEITTASILIDGSSSIIADGTPVALDPGSHALKVTAGSSTQELQVHALEGEKNRRVQITLNMAPHGGERSASAGHTAGNVDGQVAPSSSPSHGRSWLLAPVIVTGVAVVATVTGVFFQMTALSEDSKSRAYASDANREVVANQAQCSPSPPDKSLCPNAYGMYTHRDAAKTDQAVAIPLMAGGALGLVAGGILFAVMWPKSTSSLPHSGWMITPTLGPNSSGFGLVGTF